MKNFLTNYCNEYSYKNTGTDNENFADFVNYLGEQIKDCRIYEDIGITSINSACLLWQDSKFLVRNVALSNDKHYLTFEIPQSAICEGNALLAIRDNNDKIIWSWHIWVYKPETDKTITNGSNVYKIMPSYLGYCHPRNRYYPEKTCYLKFTQTRTGYSKIVTIVLSKGEIADVGNSVYYQWGRKDPFPGQLLDWKEDGKKDYFGAINKPVYDEHGMEIISSTIYEGRMSLSDAISNPQIQAVTPNNNDVIWHTDIPNKASNTWYENLWSVKYSTNKYITKSIYDPSPVGYSVPSSKTFGGMNSKIKKVSSESFRVTLDINGTELNLPWTLHRTYKGNYLTNSAETYEIDNFNIWVSAAEAYATLKPGAKRNLWVTTTSKIKNYALPLIVVQNSD